GTLFGGIPLVLANGNLQGQIGFLFWWKVGVLLALLLLSLLISRPFCRYLCPLGAIYGLFNRFCLIGVKTDENACNNCGLCVKKCQMDVLHVGDHECIQCGECTGVCPCHAIVRKPFKKA
ncbi:MAG: 4Fe-4S binding protein, partial [Lachnospiraceae bacterium]|nr:4Fe-4S binding protein [Lachnospiraceae bacterium]